MGAIQTEVGITTLDAGIFVANVDYGYKTISLKLISGTVTYSGTLSLMGVTPPASATTTPKTLDDNGFFVTSDNPIDGFTVDATAGVVEIAFTK